MTRKRFVDWGLRRELISFGARVHITNCRHRTKFNQASEKTSRYVRAAGTSQMYSVNFFFVTFGITETSFNRNSRHPRGSSIASL